MFRYNAINTSINQSGTAFDIRYFVIFITLVSYLETSHPWVGWSVADGEAFLKRFLKGSET